MMRYVLGLAFSEDGSRIALIRKNLPLWQAGLLNGIGGKIEHGETPLEAMMREFEEETALLTGPDDWTHAFTLKGEDFECVFFKAFLHELDYVTSPTDETVEIHPSLPAPLDSLAGLHWQIPFALDNLAPGIEITDLGGREIGETTPLSEAIFEKRALEG